MNTPQWYEVVRGGGILVLKELPNPQTSVHGDFVVIPTGEYSTLTRDAARWRAINERARSIEADIL